MEKKIMFFVIPEMPSKTFVMLYKKLPDQFKYNGRATKIGLKRRRINSYAPVTHTHIEMKKTNKTNL